MKQRIVVIGDGGWGTAVALTLVETGHDVVLWSHDADYSARMHRERENTKFLPGVPLPAALELSSDREVAAAGATVAVNAVPTRFLRPVMESFTGILPRRIPIVSLTKGIEHGSLLRPCQILRELHPGHPTAVLSGPSHAEEVALGIPASVVLAARSTDLAVDLQKTFSTKRLRVYTNSDPVGVELGGALKNVIAIAAGVCDGLGFGDNTKAALVTRGLVEIVRLAVPMGAKKQTFTGLAGLGDLITTAFSRHGRNRAVGEKIGKGIPLKRILGEMETVAEGVYTTESVIKLARQKKIEMPISREVHEMLFKGKDPAKALESLMKRTRKNEAWY